MDLVQAHAHGAVGRGLSCLVGRWGVRRSLSYSSSVSQHLPATIKPPLPPLLSSVHPSSAPPVLISDDPSPPPRKVRNFHPPRNARIPTCSAVLLPLSLAAALGRTPGGSDHHAADLGIHSRCGGGIAMRSRGSCVILAGV
jgi:hypothetical protein